MSMNLLTSYVLPQKAAVQDIVLVTKQYPVHTGVVLSKTQRSIIIITTTGTIDKCIAMNPTICRKLPLK